MRRPLAIWVALAVALAALSLTLPYKPVYDPWGWLVWGREIAHLELATAGGPSWKPLPALLATPLSLLGEAAPKGWLFVARGGWLLAPVLAGWLAARLAGPDVGRWGAVAALVAAASVALPADELTPPARQLSGGLSEPLLVSLLLGAVALALAHRARGALWLGVGAALLRPECWPFLALWGWREARREPGLRPHAAAAAVLIPVAWFVPDLLGAGDPLQGSETARQGGVDPGELPEVAGRALAAPLAVVWLGVALFLVGWRGEGRRARALRVLLAGAAAWVAVVGLMSVAGYAGLPRFLAPATAAFAVVGGAGLARAGAGSFGRGASRPALAAAVLAALVLAAGGFGLRVARVPGDIDTIEAQTRSQEDLFELAKRVGAGPLLRCGGRVRVGNLLAQTALAWRLERPISSILVQPRSRYGVALTPRPRGGILLGTEGRWWATRLPCEPGQASSARGRLMAGVSGGAR